MPVLNSIERILEIYTKVYVVGKGVKLNLVKTYEGRKTGVLTLRLEKAVLALEPKESFLGINLENIMSTSGQFVSMSCWNS